jgi:hypothetical protein
MTNARDGITLDDAAIVVDLYAGAHGPTLLLDTQRIPALQEIAMLLGQLAGQGHTEIHLASREGFVLCPGLSDVVMTEGKPRRLGVLIEAAGHVVTWRQESARWADDLMRVEELVKAAAQGEAAHQYLSDYLGQLVIELTYGE